MSTSASVPGTAYSLEQEIRFGIVMFGGVSLAIYMNGISQEMLRMVRATAGDDGAPLLPDSVLAGTERVYRKLGQILFHGRKPGDPPPADLSTTPVRTRFVIDILSGTSAGGINAIFLAKALANNQSLKSLTQTWRVEADLKTLLNDKGSEPGKYPTNTPKRSLLNSRRMYGLLVAAMKEMSEEQPGRALAEEIDLFVTATDLNGVISPISLADEVIEERVHKADFHFVYSKTRAGLPNDFTPEYDDMLAFAARSTSSFPLAFEPVRPVDANPVAPGFTAKLGASTRADVYRQFFLQLKDSSLLDPAQRSLADGGYLQNKPFSFVIDTIRYRTADLPVARKLLYVDPFPERFSAGGQIQFDFVENTLLAASTLPRYQTIREDLDRLQAFNMAVQKGRDLMEEIETSEEFRHNDCTSSSGTVKYPERTLTSMLEQRGVCYLGYHRMRVSWVTWDLALLVSRLFGFRDDSAELIAIRDLLHCWRTDVYHPNGEPARDGGERRLTENRFLADFDFDYRMRRIDHLRKRIDETLAALRQESAGFESAGFIPGSYKVPLPPREGALQWLHQFRADVIAARRELVKARERLWLLYACQPLDPALKEFREQLANTILSSGLDAQHFEWILQPVSDDAIQERADDLYDPEARRVSALSLLNRKSGGARQTILSPPTGVRAAFRAAAGQLASELRKPFSDSSQLVYRMLRAPLPSHGLTGLRDFLLREYENFDCRDVYLFACVQDHQAGEGVPVEVYRVSPLETWLRTRSSPDGSDKLAGTAVMAFGGFLSAEWRDNDILWGRLDGTDRLIRSLLPDDADRTLCEALIAEATETILDDDFHLNGCDGLLGRLAEYVRIELQKHKVEISAQKALDYFSQDSKFNPRIMVPIISAIRKSATLTAVFEEIYEKPGPPPVETQVEYIRRSLDVFSSMLQGLDDYPGVLKTAGRYIGSVSSVCTRFVEFSLGNSLLNGLFIRWLLWLYSTEILLIAIGFIYSPVKAVGWVAFGVTVLIHAVSSMIGRRLGRPGSQGFISAIGAVVFLVVLLLLLEWIFHFHLTVQVNPTVGSVWRRLHL